MKALRYVLVIAMLGALPGCSWLKKDKNKSSARMYEGDESPHIRMYEEEEGPGSQLHN